MITHVIERYARPVVVYSKTDTKFRGQHGSEEHKEFIFRRSYGAFKFKEGDKIKYHKRKGIITEVYDRYDDLIQWTGLKPRFVEIVVDGNLYVVHPSQVKRMR